MHFLGTKGYMAPEIYEGTGYNNKVDIFALPVGCRIDFDSCSAGMGMFLGDRTMSLISILLLILRSQRFLPGETLAGSASSIPRRRGLMVVVQ